MSFTVKTISGYPLKQWLREEKDTPFAKCLECGSAPHAISHEGRVLFLRPETDKQYDKYRSRPQYASTSRMTARSLRYQSERRDRAVKYIKS